MVVAGSAHLIGSVCIIASLGNSLTVAGFL